MGKALSGELSCPCDRSCMWYYADSPDMAFHGIIVVEFDKEHMLWHFI